MFTIACCILAWAETIWAVMSRPSTTWRIGFISHRPGFKLELCAKAIPLRVMRIAKVDFLMLASRGRWVKVGYGSTARLAAASSGRNALAKIFHQSSGNAELIMLHG